MAGISERGITETGSPLPTAIGESLSGDGLITGRIGGAIGMPAAGFGSGDRLAAPGASYPSFQAAKAQAVAAFERRYLVDLLTRTRGNISAAARLAQKERRALGKLVKKHGIDKRHFQSLAYRQ